ncbi:hypothetical protein BaRGS_00031850 [Batillaria attramentaria]|uniref:Uncharacterized protein n=1 Tax=Batillaria attramentaria TaxID=370345 RepID=A0ABD0JQA9_9CAEN
MNACHPSLLILDGGWKSSRPHQRQSKRFIDWILCMSSRELNPGTTDARPRASRVPATRCSVVCTSIFGHVVACAVPFCGENVYFRR